MITFPRNLTGVNWQLSWETQGCFLLLGAALGLDKVPQAASIRTERIKKCKDVIIFRDLNKAISLARLVVKRLAIVCRKEQKLRTISKDTQIIQRGEGVPQNPRFHTRIIRPFRN